MHIVDEAHIDEHERLDVPVPSTCCYGEPGTAVEFHYEDPRWVAPEDAS